MADWDAESARLHDNLKQVLRTIRDSAKQRAPISVEDAKRWHAAIMDGLDAPDPNYVGRFRGEPGLERLGVRIDAQEGTPPQKVAEEVAAFERHLARAIQYLDTLLAPGTTPSADVLDAVIDVCGWAHAEWVRIHPFANGNGRVARLWANMIAMRYGLPPFVRLRPRPEGDDYALASVFAMNGDWRPTADVFRAMLEDFLHR